MTPIASELPAASCSLLNRHPSEGLRLAALQRDLLDHPLYDAVRDRATLKIFMGQHVFAVWDFMSLLKRLQREVTCVTLPWMPPARSDLCRFITEILLAEECDEDGEGGHLSHFELYCRAMREIGAETETLGEFLARLSAGAALSAALDQQAIFPATREFVTFTLRLAEQGEPSEVAAAFFFGREDLIPDMFARLVGSLERDGLQIPRFLHYLQRHIEVDGDQHGPLAERLLTQLCAGDADRERRALDIAGQSLAARLALWNGILAAVRK